MTPPSNSKEFTAWLRDLSAHNKHEPPTTPHSGVGINGEPITPDHLRRNGYKARPHGVTINLSGHTINPFTSH
ncbi:hypothetical protein CPPEL_01750 [Corynebacterium pseudopelargi]|uniref:Uncharacterized protein n=1 Tax=Corynebacterium pseudopelargi TaxID=2080757 RepID=A0A3G6ISD3_9CORY|nr:hypothetical protein CPPEL_01750 [Corynebacterium pseudopelargi]